MAFGGHRWQEALRGSDHVVLAVLLLLLWICPAPFLRLDPGLPEIIPLMMFSEFFFAHAGAGLAVADLRARTRGGRILSILLLGTVYGSFAVCFSLLTHSATPLVVYGIRVIMHVTNALKHVSQRRTLSPLPSFFRVMLFLLATVPAMIIPWPVLGASRAVFPISGTGLFAEGPHRMLIWGVCYFLGVFFMDIALAGKWPGQSLRPSDPGGHQTAAD